MINNSSDNVIVSPAGQSEINLLERRLLNFQQEITDVKKDLDILKIELEKINREKEYQQSLLDTVESSLAEKRVTLDALIQEIQERDADLEELKAKNERLKSHHKNKDEEISFKETKLTEAENAHKKLGEDFEKKYTVFLEDQKALKKAKDALIKVIEGINL